MAGTTSSGTRAASSGGATGIRVAGAPAMPAAGSSVAPSAGVLPSRHQRPEQHPAALARPGLALPGRAAPPELARATAARGTTVPVRPNAPDARPPPPADAWRPTALADGRRGPRSCAFRRRRSRRNIWRSLNPNPKAHLFAPVGGAGPPLPTTVAPRPRLALPRCGATGAPAAPAAGAPAVPGGAGAPAAPRPALPARLAQKQKKEETGCWCWCDRKTHTEVVVRLTRTSIFRCLGGYPRLPPP